MFLDFPFKLGRKNLKEMGAFFHIPEGLVKGFQQILLFSHLEGLDFHIVPSPGQVIFCF